MRLPGIRLDAHPRRVVLHSKPMFLRLADDTCWSLERPRLAGILNVTPDSFSDGGRYVTVAAAVARGLEMARQGADMIDVGGESTRPGAAAVSAAEQIHRVVPVIAALRRELNPRSSAGSRTLISIDARLPQVAQAALDAGADVINDIAGGRTAGMLELAARRNVPIVLMHMQGDPATMQDAPVYQDVVREVGHFLRQAVTHALAAGVRGDRLVLDPGIGFGKTTPHNLQLLAHLRDLVHLSPPESPEPPELPEPPSAEGWPVMLGASRKRFLRAVLSAASPDVASTNSSPPTTDPLVLGTCITTALGVAAGVRLFRVHDVAENRAALDTAWAIMQTPAH